MTRWKTGIIVIAIAAVIIMVGAVGSNIYAAGSDGLFENLDEIAQGHPDAGFLKYRDNYYIDTEKVSFFKSPLSVMFSGICNFLFALQKGIAEFQISIFSFSFSTNLYVMLDEFITPFFNGMKTYIFDGFSLTMISLCAVFFMIKIIQNRQTQVIIGLIQLVCVIALAFTFYTYPVKVLIGIDEITTDLSNSVMEGPYNAVNGGGGASTSVEDKAAALIWNLMVHKPWQQLEFGGVNVAEEYEEEILKLEPDSKEREELIKKLADDKELFSKSTAYQLQRIVMAIILGLFELVLCAILLAFCILIIGYQFLTLLFMIMGMFVFLLALIPFFGTELLKRWGIKMLALSATKILLVFFLSIILVLIDVMYQFTDTHGLLFTMFIIIVMIVMVYWKRREIVGLFTGFKIGAAASGATQPFGRALDKDWNALQSLRNADRSMRAHGEHVIQPQNSASSNNGGHDMRRGAPDRNQSSTINGGIYGGAELKEAAYSMSKSSNDLSRYFNKAESLLQKQYDKSAKQSEETAAQQGKDDVKYGNFVKRTDAVRSLGTGNFDQRDVAAVANMVKNVERKGGDVDHIVTGSKQDTYNSPVERPQNISQASELRQSAALRAVSNSKERENRTQGLTYFKENFGEEKGERIYSDLSRKYDSVAVDSFASDEKLTSVQIQKRLKREVQEEQRPERLEPLRK